MGVHDWSRVADREFHDFHNRWTARIAESLNVGKLPKGYFARCEQKYGTPIADVLTFFSPPEANGYHAADSGTGGGVALAVAPPRVKSVLLEPPVGYRNRAVVIRQEADERPVAVLEVVSRSNKDTAKRHGEFVAKVRGTLDAGIHVVLLDLLPPSDYSPGGLHVSISSDIGLNVSPDRPEWQPAERPIATISYLADRMGMRAYYEYLKVGDPFPELPLFLNTERYINLPLSETYDETFRGTAGITRQKLEG
jgi:Protein of unknown function (DUF4058)